MLGKMETGVIKGMINCLEHSFQSQDRAFESRLLHVGARSAVGMF